MHANFGTNTFFLSNISLTSIKALEPMAGFEFYWFNINTREASSDAIDIDARLIIDSTLLQVAIQMLEIYRKWIKFPTINNTRNV